MKREKQCGAGEKRCCVSKIIYSCDIEMMLRDMLPDYIAQKYQICPACHATDLLCNVDTVPIYYCMYCKYDCLSLIN